PTASGSDVFGALARAALECDSPGRPWRLVIFSDMRQVGRGVDLEHPGVVPARLMAQVRSQGLVPQLRGVAVWALGVHTMEIDERQWQSLREFWTEYFRAAGAELKAFSPDRRLTE